MTTEEKISPAQLRQLSAASSKPDIKGCRATEFKIIIKPVKVSDQSEGGILYDDNVKDQMQRAISKGSLVGVSPFAFSFLDPDCFTYEQALEKWPGAVPRIGDLVMFGRYCGNEFYASDGDIYRIMNDKDVMMIITEDVKSFDEKLLGH